MKIEGIPDGWELVRIGKPFINERYISLSGNVTNCVCIPSGEAYAIVRKIRKIEKPKQYRPFANAAEFEPYWGKPVRSKSEAAVDSLSAVVFAGRLTVDVVFPDSIRTMKYAEAFDILIFANGTPFGIEVTE